VVGLNVEFAVSESKLKISPKLGDGPVLRAAFPAVPVPSTGAALLLTATEIAANRSKLNFTGSVALLKPRLPV
jgi:hypothetical protein